MIGKNFGFLREGRECFHEASEPQALSRNLV